MKDNSNEGVIITRGSVSILLLRDGEISAYIYLQLNHATSKRSILFGMRESCSSASCYKSSIRGLSHSVQGGAGEASLHHKLQPNTAQKMSVTEKYMMNIIVRSAGEECSQTSCGVAGEESL